MSSPQSNAAMFQALNEPKHLNSKPKPAKTSKNSKSAPQSSKSQSKNLRDLVESDSDLEEERYVDAGDDADDDDDDLPSFRFNSTADLTFERFVCFFTFVCLQSIPVLGYDRNDVFC